MATKTAETKQTAQVMPCKCQHPFQDKTYGKGMRVHTRGLKHWCCTVCCTVKSATPIVG